MFFVQNATDLMDLYAVELPFKIQLETGVLPVAPKRKKTGGRVKRFESRQEYIKWYRKKHAAKARAYRIQYRERINLNNKLLRRKKGKIPREIWIRLLKDKEVWKAQHSSLPKTDHTAWRELLHRKMAEFDATKISNQCADCEILFTEVPRCSRNPDYCRGCWSHRYVKKIATQKDSLLYAPKMV